VLRILDREAAIGAIAFYTDDPQSLNQGNGTLSSSMSSMFSSSNIQTSGKTPQITN